MHTHIKPLVMVFFYRYFLLLFSFLLSSSIVAKDFHYSQTANLKAAYMAANSLKLKEADRWLSKEKAADPTNLLTLHVENYIDFYKLVILEEEALYERLAPNKDRRLAQIQQGPTDSPYYLYSQAEIELQWALVKLKFDDYYKAFFEVKKAYKKLIKNQERFPDFVANKKSLGVIHSLIGTLPDKHQWGIKLLSGMEGDINLGRRELETVINHYDAADFFFVEEAKIMYAFVLFFILEDKSTAWEIIKKARINPEKNLLGVFVKALMAYEDGQQKYAYQLLRRRPRGEEYLDFYYLDYLEGLLLVNQLSPKANQYLLKFVKNFKGRNYIKKAYELLIWHDQIFNFGQNQQAYRSKILTSGAQVVDDDKRAFKNATEGYSLNLTLLKARLLFDGGNYTDGKALMNRFEVASFLQRKDQVEYCYRNGRFDQVQNKPDSAIDWFNKALALGDTEDIHACKSALEAGRVEEKRANYQKAISYYDRCQSIHPVGYESSLHMKAKAGIQRIRHMN